MIDTTDISLANLIQRSTLYLNELGYSEETKKNYRLNWKRLKKYAETKNLNEFSLELGKEFLSDCYGIDQGKKLSSSQVFKVRCINVLDEFCQYKSFQKCHQPSGRIVPAPFKSVLDEYIQLQKKLQLSARTIQGKQIRIIHFFIFLDKFDINVSN